MAIIENVCQAAGVTPEELIGTEIKDLEDMENTESTDAAAGEDMSSSPGCRFDSCFACENGHCTALTDNDFGGKMCPFFKNKAHVKRSRQDALDHLLIDGRFDLVNKYEKSLIELGVIEPEKHVDEYAPDDDLISARAEFAQFQRELESEADEESEDDSFFWDDEEADDEEESDEEADGEDANNEDSDTEEVSDESDGDADEAEDSGVQ